VENEQGNPYAAPDAGGAAPAVLARDATCDRLSTLALMAAAGAVLAFAAYWVASPETTEPWFYVTLSLMGIALVLGLASLVLGRVRHARRGRAKAAVLVAVSPVLFMLTFYVLTFGSMWLWTKVLTSLGVGY
jgi:hypothetical protein